MPLAVTHVLTTVILVDIYRDYVAKHKKYFTLHTIFLAGVFSLLPDIDVPISMVAGLMGWNVPWLFQHGGVTHTPFFGLLFLIPGLILWRKKKHHLAVIFFVAAFAIIFHIFLDFLLGGGRYEGIMWLFPFSTTSWSLHLIRYYEIPALPQALDATILLLWLWHEEAKHKIKDFI